uniref:Coronin n=1 Tax=Oncorhynchus mykiss TaxID=8022 RepID=A0A8K9WWY0_ONCMY
NDRSFTSQGNHIKSSTRLVAFNTDQAGMLGLTSVEPGSDGKWTVTVIPCHADLITDLDFSPFDDNLLATCSADETVKLWRVCEPEQEQPGGAEVTLCPGEGRLELVAFHPTSSGLLAVGSTKTAQLWDTSRQQSPLAALEPHGDQLQSLSWKQDGSLLASSCKVSQSYSIQSNSVSSCVSLQSAQGLQSNKDSRILWVKDSDHILTTGFDQMRGREVRLWDSRKLGSSLGSANLGTSNGTLMPLFDPDSGLLTVSGMVRCSLLSPLTDMSHCLTEAPTRGVAMVPKLALDVLSCEVMRVLQLTDSFIVPINYHVPRKEFHADLYPDTLGRTAAMSAAEWWKGGEKQLRSKITLLSSSSLSLPLSPSPPPPSLSLSLPPSPPPPPSLSLSPPPSPPPPLSLPPSLSLSSSSLSLPPSLSSSLSLPLPPSPPPPSLSPSLPPSPPSLSLSSSSLSLPHSLSSSLSLPLPPSLSSSSLSLPLPPSPPPPGPSSKFRHLQGAVLHRDTHFTNLKGLNLTTPGECDGFCANRHRVAVPLATAGGQIAIFELSQAGKLADTGLPTIQNSVNVADFSWDPFNSHRLVVAGDDAKIRVWQVPEGGLTETLTEPETILQGHTEKIYSVKFHPLASGLLASSSYDQTVRLWNLESGDEVKALRGHQDQIFGMAWSPDGKLLATVCKDGKLRIYDPRKSADPVQEGAGPEGHRGARVVWVCDGKYLMVSGFDSRSERTLYLHSVESLSSGAIASAPTDVSPSTLIPFYDPDTSVVILTGKGDTRVYIFEIVPEAPYFLECASFNSSEPHKGLAFLPKTECVVQEVEVARGLRLSKTSIEPVAFRVPRVRKEFFQDDVYPDTAVWWESSLTASAWLAGSDGKHQSISLKPKDMTPVSEAPKEVQVRKYLPSSHYLEEKTDEQKKDELLSAMIGKLGNMDDNPLPQESFQGVEDDEWVSDTHTNTNVHTDTHTHTHTNVHTNTHTFTHALVSFRVTSVCCLADQSGSSSSQGPVGLKRVIPVCH